MLPDLRERKSVVDEVYEAVKQGIFTCHFRPGQRLLLADIEEQMGISRTPLKEALARLAMEGLVEVRPRIGTFVTHPTLEEIAQKCEVRRILETHALELAAQRITKEHLHRMQDILQESRRMIDVEGWARGYERWLELDHEMLRLLMDAAGNIPLKRLWEQVNVHVQEARALHTLAVAGRLDEIEETELNPSQEEHEEILRALEAKDILALRQVMNDHIERAKRLSSIEPGER